MALQSPASTAVSRAGDCLWATREKYETDLPEKDSLCHGIELFRRNGCGYGVSDSKDEVDTTALYNVLLRLVFRFIVYIFRNEFRQSVSNSKDDVDITALYNVLLWLVFCFIVYIFWKEFRQSGTGYRLSQTSHVSDSKYEVAITALYNVLLWLVFCFIVYIFWEEFRQSETGCILSRTSQDEFIPGSQAGKVSYSKDEVDTTALYNVLLCLVFCFIVYIFWKKFRQSEKFKKKIGELQQEIDRRKAQYKSVWKNAPLYADWRKEEFKAVTVTLDAATAHPALHLSENGRRVTWQERGQDLPSSTQRFESLPCVLGQLHISSGRCYWEVEVGNAHSWDLGVCRDNVTRKGRITMSPQNGFWAIRFYSGEYWALTSPETLLTLGEEPLKVGIFLDYEDGDVSFYNMTDGSHIFSFPKNTFHGVLRSLFRLWSSDSGSLAICPGEEK